MRNGQVTPAGGPQVVPVLYLDLDVVETDNEGITLEDEMERWPGLDMLKLTDSGPSGGHPIYRIEGPLTPLVGWLRYDYCGGDNEQAIDLLADAKLAR